MFSSNSGYAISSWRCCLVLLLVFALVASTMAAPLPQTAGNDSDSPDQSMYSDSGSDTGSAGRQPANESRGMSRQSSAIQVPQLLSSERMIDILQQQPELLATLKYAAIQQLKQRLAGASGAGQAPTDSWETLDADSITDDAFFSRIEQDTDLRIMVSRELIKRGYDEFGGPDRELTQSEPSEPSSRTSYSSASSALRQREGGETLESRLREPLEPESRRRTRQPTEPESRRPRQPQEEREPQMLHRRSPYPTLPSLKDLYSQYPTAETKLKRFGSDTFRYGTGNAEELPMDLPAGPDYVLGPGCSIFGGASPNG
jgi:hypothetical protein